MSAGFPYPQNEVIDLRGNVLAIDDVIIDGESIGQPVIDITDLEQDITDINEELIQIQDDLENKMDVGDNATTASTLQTPRAITLTGDASGTASFDGSEDIEIAVTVTDIAGESVLSSVSVTRNEITSTAFFAVIQTIRTVGYASIGDGGAALYKRVTSEPSHAGKVRSADRWLPNGTSNDDDGGWWEIAESVIRPEMLGAAGDGAEADEQAVQDAVDTAVAIGAQVVGHGLYRITAPVVVPSNFHLDGLGLGQFIKDFVSAGGNADAMFVNENYGVLDPDGDVSNVSIRNVLLKTADSTATSALISFVNINGLVLDNVRTEKTSQGWSIHLSGQNIYIKGVRPTSAGPGTNIDGLHFNWVKNLTIDGIVADTEDDCIAFTADPTSWTGSGPVGMVAQNITINNCVLRSKTGGLRIGNGIISSGESGADDVDPDLAFRKIVVSNTLIQKTDATGSLLALEDRRSNANAKHTEISFVNCRFRMTGAARLVNLLGNDDPADGAKTWKNYGSIEFKGCYFESGIGELFAGAATSGVGGAFDVLRILDCWIVRLTETAVDNSFNLRNFGAIEVRNLRFRDKLAGPRAFYLREYDRIFMSDIFYENDSTGSDAAAFLAPDNPNAGAIVVLEGVVVNGDVQYRLQGVSAVTIPSLYISGGGAKTTVGDIAPNVSYTAGELYGQRTYVTIADDSVYTFRPPGNFGRLNITSQLSGADGEVQYRTSAYPSLGVSATLVRDGGSLTASTSVLAGTTGTDGKLNIAPDASGNIRIENRLGSSVNVAFFVSPFGTYRS